jgi:hypothetical protein
MATSLNDNLPEVLKSVRTQPLFVMRLDVRKLLIVGATPGGYRASAWFPGARLRESDYLARCWMAAATGRQYAMMGARP